MRKTFFQEGLPAPGTQTTLQNEVNVRKHLLELQKKNASFWQRATGRLPPIKKTTLELLKELSNSSEWAWNPFYWNSRKQLAESLLDVLAVGCQKVLDKDAKIFTSLVIGDKQYYVGEVVLKKGASFQPGRDTDISNYRLEGMGTMTARARSRSLMEKSTRGTGQTGTRTAKARTRSLMDQRTRGGGRTARWTARASSRARVGTLFTRENGNGPERANFF
ncbi:unnamed protein product [Amoebophrya sp. A120]|nr:unnamed protein product [Amoebophrya sp. A120]|eukprot:GSA120T00013523001.1